MRQQQNHGVKIFHNFAWTTWRFALLLCCCLLAATTAVQAEPFEFTDDAGADIVLDNPPQRIVSLVPSLTEIIFALGAGDQIKGVTAHSRQPAAVHTKQIVGGYFAPCLEKIQEVNPDVVFVSSLHDQVREYFTDSQIQVISLSTGSVDDSFREIRLLGSIFSRKKEAADIVKNIQDSLDLIQAKMARIPDKEKKRVIRIMGRDQVMTPGKDSFQNEFIRLAGGKPPQLDKEGAVVPISKEEWKKFDPQVIYGCGGDREVAEKYFSRPGWKDVQAVRDGKIFWFPCDLTCRAGVHSGDFVAWLASRVYLREFSGEAHRVLPEEITGSRSLDLHPDYLQEAKIAYSRILDFENKSLIVQFSRPMCIVSTLEGQREKIRTVGNHFSPPPCWSLGHMQGLEAVRSHVYEVIGADPQTASFLFTGADMDNLAVKTQKYCDLAVTALVTAGVSSNALRMSRDTGSFYEPGTINIILLPSMRLTPRAMNRAVISATEAKTAALQDLDVRSAYSGAEHQATGTGTDNVLVAEGSGKELDNAGGHTKLGELIAKAVYAGVQEAVSRQNGLVAERSVFHRLQERGVDLYAQVREMDVPEALQQEMLSRLYSALLEPEYDFFMQASLSMSDARQRGQLGDMASFKRWAREVTAGNPGNSEQERVDRVEQMDFPQVLQIALNAVLSGVQSRVEEKQGAGDE